MTFCNYPCAVGTSRRSCFISSWIVTCTKISFWWFFCICSGIYVVTSLLTPKHDEAELADLCWGNPWRTIAGGRLAGLADPRVGAGLLLVTMIVLYFFLR